MRLNYFEQNFVWCYIQASYAPSRLTRSMIFIFRLFNINYLKTSDTLLQTAFASVAWHRHSNPLEISAAVRKGLKQLYEPLLVDQKSSMPRKRLRDFLKFGFLLQFYLFVLYTILLLMTIPIKLTKTIISTFPSSR